MVKVSLDFKARSFLISIYLKTYYFLKKVSSQNKTNYRQQLIAALVIKEEAVQGHQDEDRALVCMCPT